MGMLRIWFRDLVEDVAILLGWSEETEGYFAQNARKRRIRLLSLILNHLILLLIVFSVVSMILSGFPLQAIGAEEVRARLLRAIWSMLAAILFFLMRGRGK